MPLEPVFDNIDDLDSANPALDDEVNEGDNHLRGIKNALQGNVSGDALRTALLQQAIEALGVDDTGAQVVGQVTVTDPAPLNPDELTRMDYVDALGVVAGAGLVGGGPVVGNPSVDVGPGNGIDVLADSIEMSGSFTGDLDVTGNVTSAPPGAAAHLTRLDYVDAADAAIRAAFAGVSAQRRIQVDDVQTLGGTQAAVGQDITVVFLIPFDAAPTVTLTLLNPGNQNNGFAYLNNVTATGFTATAGVAGLECHWQAIGTNA